MLNIINYIGWKQVNGVTKQEELAEGKYSPMKLNMVTALEDNLDLEHGINSLSRSLRNGIEVYLYYYY